jgi:hypothetical protein
MQHCDAHKRNAILSINPTDVASGWERALYYEAGATDEHAKLYNNHSRHPAHEADIHETLNLNVPSLGIARWAAVEAVIDHVGRKNPGAWTKAVLEREIKRFEQRDSQGRYAPFCEAILFQLRKRLARCPR